MSSLGSFKKSNAGLFERNFIQIASSFVSEKSVFEFISIAFMFYVFYKNRKN